jgi:hypothetical protein
MITVAAISWRSERYGVITMSAPCFFSRTFSALDFRPGRRSGSVSQLQRTLTNHCSGEVLYAKV